MPSNSATVKLDAVRDYGADVVLCEPTAEARESATRQVVADTGAALIHPFNDSRIICGQGTAARELLQDQPDIELLLAPVGGGGLLSGTILAATEHNSSVDVIGVEPKEADDAYRSFESGELQPANDPTTIADGLRTSLGELTFDIIRSGAAAIMTVSEREIVEAMRTVWMRMKIVIEASAAVPVAALLRDKQGFSGKKIGVILSGGNVDLDSLPWIA
jgi:threonine dehydratase